MGAAPGRNDEPNLDDPDIVEQGSFTEINIVPLVDIMLVLLVILMATSTDIIQAGTSQGAGLRVNLPTGSTADDEVSELTNELVIAVLEDGSIILDGEDLSLEELEARLQAAAERPDRLVLVQADERAFHRTVVEVMETARRAGLSNLAIATKPES